MMNEMEALLRKLEENQNMTDETASRLQPSEAPPKKYTSIFCIDGKPILPPLMTSEKRKEMQKYKEEAIKIERHLKKQYWRQHILDENNAEADESIFASLSSFCCDNISRISRISDEEADKSEQSQQKTSMLMLNDMLKMRSVGGDDGDGDSFINIKLNSHLITTVTGLQPCKKMLKLKKSQTLIHDLTKDLEEDDKMQLKKPHSEIVYGKNNTATKNKLKRPTCLYINNNQHNDHNENAGSNVPIICVNPPTPLMDEKDHIKMFRKSSKTCGKHSKDLNITTITTTASEDSSDSQSFRGAKANRGSSKDITSPTSPSVTASASATSKTSSIIHQRIKQFERIYNQNDSPKSVATLSNSSSSPVKDFRDSDSQKTNLDSLGVPLAISRSATSPSLRSTHNKNNYLPSKSVYLETSLIMPESELIRSNSFTLKAPSKALIDHMRRQQQQQQQKQQQQEQQPQKLNEQQQQYHSQYEQHPQYQQISVKSNKNNVMNRMRGFSPSKIQSRLTQDTVESRAKKKVHKVELKTSRGTLQSKSSSSKYSSRSNVTSLKSPSSISSFMQYSYPSVNNSNCNNNQKNFYKSKRSPYESTVSSSSSLIKPYTRKLLNNIGANNLSALNKSMKMQQSPYTPHKNQLQAKRQQQQQQQEQSEQQSPQQSTLKMSNNSKMPIAVNLMDGEKKELFMQLLAQQEEERRKLQEAFEMQQKILLDQLNEAESTQYPLNNDNRHHHQQNRHQQNQYQNQHQQHQERLNGNANDSKQFANDFINDGMQSAPHKSTSVLSYNSSGISIKELSSVVQIESSSISSLQNNINNVNNHSANNTLSSIDSFPSTSEQNVMHKSIVNNFGATLKQNSINALTLNNSNVSLKSMTSTPRRRLFVQDTTTLSACNLQTNYNDNNNNNNNKLNRSNNNHLNGDRETAATIINAYVRGYLVRRLFQTEHIQRLVQTIRDTLIFVLHLHMESIQNPREALEPVNIKLKGRLLQQLYSANRRLHAVLFETTIKERMNIIAQDRKRLKNKLLALQKK